MTQAIYPAISAIITSYNCAGYIGDAVESVRRQTIRVAEIIVVDDGSTDNTNELVRALRADIRYFHQDNRGEAAARNRGVALARGETIAFLDADDAWPPGRLAALSARLIEDDAVSIACGRARAFRNEAWTDALASGPGRPEAFLMSFGCALICRQVFSGIGKVDVTMQHGVDLDWFLRCREQKVPIATIDDVVLLYRRHGQNMTQNFAAGREGLMRTVKQSLERRRRNNMAAEPLPAWQSLGRDKRFGRDK
jgi:glycosyltransferase involved in cell wall biosynthesis